ncbi:MAG: mandelate racemase/muconate lactonizing enzyme family protein, partial [Pseudonocardia sp.]|nr:mandelate racemase/muconate lactonizing enzyme family protein [Pseudonocardia sp.]
MSEDYVDTASRPSALRITDLRVANLRGVPFRSSIIRIDTNQGLVGYGEVRDQASASYALMLKSRVVGENPCNLDKIFRKIKQFGHHGRQGGGVSGIEMALMDLAGKAYGVPAYALVGGRFRDRVRCYADTPSMPDPREMGERLLQRRRRGFTMLKMDVGIRLLWDVPGALIGPPGAREDTTTMHPFTGIQVTPKGVDHLAEYVATVRSVVGDDIALAADHFGHIALDSCIRIGRALEPFTLAWIEDLIPWQYTDQWRQLTEAVAVPTCTGEDI